MTGSTGALLLLADGRLPTGGHAHSGGLEEAVAAGRVRDAATLAAWLSGRLATTGRVDAALAAAATAATAATTATTATTAVPKAATTAEHPPERIKFLDAEAAARCPSPALRKASRAQGRGLLRAARRMWPDPGLDALFAWRADGVMWPVALGAVGAAIDAKPIEVATLAAQASVSGPAWAATRLLGLDPFAVARCLADLAPQVDTVAGHAADAGTHAAAAAEANAGPDCDLDAYGAPLSEIGAQLHAAWEVRLFAS